MILTKYGNVDVLTLFKHLREYENWNMIGSPFYIPDMGDKVDINQIYTAAGIDKVSYEGFDYPGTYLDLSRPTPYIPEEDREAFFQSEAKYLKKGIFIQYGYKLESNKKLTMENSGKLFKGRQEVLDFKGNEVLPVNYNIHEIRAARDTRDLMFDNAVDWRWLTFVIDPGDLPPPPPENYNTIEVLVGRLIKVNYETKEEVIESGASFFLDIPEEPKTYERRYKKEIVKTPHWIGFTKNF